MASKIVSDKQKSSSSIDQLIDTNIETLPSAIEQLLSPHSNEKVDIRPLVNGLRGFLAARTTRMEEASRAHDTELSDDPAVLQRRDDASEALYSLLTRTRETFLGIYGSAALPSLGFSGSTPQEPSLLSAAAKTIVKTLQDRSFPKPVDEEISYNPSKRISEIEAAILQLDAALADALKEKREADQTITARNAAINAYDEAFSKVANILTSLFALVDQKDLARRAKPSDRRPGQTEEAPPETK